MPIKNTWIRVSIVRSRVRKILTENLIAGMVMFADVRDRSGRLLLKAGTELTNNHLYILRSWGIVEAEVVNAEEYQENPACSDPIVPAWDDIEAEMKPIFSHTDLNHPAIKELLRIRIVREARRGVS